MVGVVFSRDRALQLDAALRSFCLHCADPETIRLFVIYKTTSDHHRRQYLQLAKEHSVRRSIVFLSETVFRSDVLNILVAGRAATPGAACWRWLVTLAARLRFPGGIGLSRDPLPYVLFLVDDCVFVRTFQLRAICEALSGHPEALGFSLRLGTNTSYCYMQDKTQAVPSFIPLTHQMLEFDWTTAEDDFAYALELSSSVYRLVDVSSLVSRLAFENPNQLEAQIASHVKFFNSVRPCLLCYQESRTFCAPLNKAQAQYATNRAGTKAEHTTEHLAQVFDQGYRIDVGAYTDFLPNACHQEVELFLKKHDLR